MILAPSTPSGFQCTHTHRKCDLGYAESSLSDQIFCYESLDEVYGAHSVDGQDDARWILKTDDGKCLEYHFNPVFIVACRVLILHMVFHLEKESVRQNPGYCNDESDRRLAHVLLWVEQQERIVDLASSSNSNTYSSADSSSDKWMKVCAYDLSVTSLSLFSICQQWMQGRFHRTYDSAQFYIFAPTVKLWSFSVYTGICARLVCLYLLLQTYS